MRYWHNFYFHKSLEEPRQCFTIFINLILARKFIRLGPCWDILPHHNGYKHILVPRFESNAAWQSTKYISDISDTNLHVWLKWIIHNSITISRLRGSIPLVSTWSRYHCRTKIGDYLAPLFFKEQLHMYLG